MCGIAGAFSFKGNKETTVRNMGEALHHRGPDSAGYYQSGPFYGAMRRLSINDLEGGQQPLFSEDRSVILLYNGEIYNSPELRKELEKEGCQFRTHSDGEVICHLFQRYGVEAFDQLDGMFAISLWSEKEQALYLVRDLPGEKPLYYTQDAAGSLYYASELKAFRAVQDLALDLNMQALWDFPSFLWIPEPDTVYENVFALPRGHYLRFDGTNSIVKPIENPFSAKHRETKPNPDNVRQVVEDAVKSRLLSDVPVGCFLSSGLDSSIVTTIAQRELGNVTTFSIGFENVDDPYHGKADESAHAKEYADIIGTTHHEIRVTAQDFKEALPVFCQYGDQPFAVSSGLGILFVAQAARQRGIKTLLSGDGADELFGGYSWYRDLKHPALKGDPVLDSRIVSYQNFGLSVEERLAKMAGYSNAKKAWAWHYYAAEEEKELFFNQEAFEGLLGSHRYFDQYKPQASWQAEDYVYQDRTFYLPYEMMRKLDRMTMAHSVEGRAPFVAPEVLALCNNLTYADMVQEDTLKPLLRKAFDDMLPPLITKRPKHGFNVPIDHWLKGDWSNLVEEALSPSSALNRLKLLSQNADRVVKGMLFDKDRLNGHSVLCLIMLNMWLEQQGF